MNSITNPASKAGISQLGKLIASLALPLALGSIAGFFTSSSVNSWYLTLNQPSFNPPSWVFGPVWTALYLLMGYSFFLIWTLKPSRQRRKAIVLYLVQLTFNFVWSIIFFHYKSIGIALADIIVLWILILLTINAFYKLKTTAAFINIPYLLWVTFAAVLNLAYWFLN